MGRIFDETITLTNLPAHLKGGLSDGYIAKADAIYAKDGKSQADINEELVQSIGAVNIPVKSVKTGDKALALTGTELSTTLGLTYTTGKKIALTGIGGAEIASIDVADFIKDKVVSSAELVETAEAGVGIAVPYIKLVFNDASTPIRFSVKSLVDVYTGANLKLSDSYASTTAAAPAAGVTADAAIKNLATRLGTVEGKTYVDSIGGKKGAITLNSGSTTSGQVNFAIGTDNKITATVVDTAYAKSADVASTYLSKTDASTTYETKNDAAKLATKTELGEVEAKIPVNVVNTIGGKTGAVTLKGGNTTDGTVNLAISTSNEVSATIVGIANYAKKSDVSTVQDQVKDLGDRISTIEGFNIASELSGIHDSITANTTEIGNALNSVAAGTADSYVTLTVGAKASKSQTITVKSKTQAVSTASTSANGLALANDVKSYVNTTVSNYTSKGLKVASGGSESYITLDVRRNDGDHYDYIAATNKLQAVSTASSTANGLATAFDIKQNCLMASVVGDTEYDEWDTIVSKS